MDEATKELLRECAADYYNALREYGEAVARLHTTEENVKATLAANKLYDTFHVHVEGSSYIVFEYDPECRDSFCIAEEDMNLVGDKNGR